MLQPGFVNLPYHHEHYVELVSYYATRYCCMQATIIPSHLFRNPISLPFDDHYLRIYCLNCAACSWAVCGAFDGARETNGPPSGIRGLARWCLLLLLTCVYIRQVRTMEEWLPKAYVNLINEPSETSCLIHCFVLSISNAEIFKHPR